MGGDRMLEHLPPEIEAGLRLAQKRDLKRKSRLRVHIGGQVFPVLRLWDNGLALDASQTTHLRGSVDVYDGAVHIFQCLIIASSVENGELICDFKRSTSVVGAPALDFWKDENAPVAYLTKS
jgi:hypothetical protein